MTRVSILPLETDGHVETAIPWYVNETLAPEERSRVEAHLAECEQCRDSCQVELRLRQQLRISAESTEYAAEIGWNALVGSLSDPEPRRQRRAELRASRLAKRNARPASLSVLLLAQAAAIAAIAFALLNVLEEVNAPRYRTLTESSSPIAASASTLRVVFANDATSARIQELLDQIGGTISAGPTASNVYTVELSHSASRSGGGNSQREIHGASISRVMTAEEAAQWLRAQSGVRFAEPVGAPP